MMVAPPTCCSMLLAAAMTGTSPPHSPARCRPPHVVNRNAEENDPEIEERRSGLAGDRIREHEHRRQQEDDGYDRVTDRAIGPRQIRSAFPQDEHGTDGERVKRPDAEHE